jgi:hypothetical protein
MSNSIRIYALTDPRDDLARYVGKTRQTLAQRLSLHLVFREPSSAHDAWLLGLRKLNLVPAIIEIDAFGPAERNSREEEAFWVRTYLAEGHPLVNERGWRGLGTIVRPFSVEEKIALAAGKILKPRKIPSSVK